MEVGSLNDALLKGLQQAQSEQITALSKILGLKIGSELTATVQKMTVATPEEREQLLKQIEINLSQLNKNSAAPAVKALVNQLVAQQQLLKSPQLTLVSLQLPSSLPTNQLLAYTDKPLLLGQQVLLRLIEGQRLMVLEPSSTTNQAHATLPASTTAPASLATGPARLAALLQASLINKSAEVGTASSPLLAGLDSKSATQAISDSLRNLLPQKGQGQDVLAALPKITQFIQQLPSSERNHWLSSQVQQALKSVADHLRSPMQLTNPTSLATAVNNSGIQFENKIAQLADAVAAIKSGATPASSQLGLANPSLTSKLTTNNSTLPPPVKLLFEQVARQDLKGALLGLLHHLGRELETTSRSGGTPPPATMLPPTSQTSVQANIPQPTNDLMMLLGQLIHKQTPELSQKVLRAQLAMLMQQHTLGSLAKIQLQQIHTLNSQRTQTDAATPTQSWQVEIPIRTGSDIHPLQMQFEHYWVDDESAADTKVPTKVKQWNIQLTFELPIVGQFFAHLTMVGSNLSAKLWAEKTSTLADAKSKVDELKNQLETQGIKVTNMQCLPGLPPQTKISLSYSLVDVQT